MDPLVSVPWLASHLGQPNLLVLDATLPPMGVTPAPDRYAAYREQHIPGAVYFNIEALSDKATGLPHMLLPPDAFAAALGGLGLGQGMTVVVYEQGDVFSAPRAWWMLRMAGMRKVYVLQGGLRAWVDAGQPVEAGEIQRAPVHFGPASAPEGVCDLAHLRKILSTEGKAQVVDARSAGRFLGTAPEPRPGLRSGHMPGALNVPYTELIHGPELAEVEEARKVFASHGVTLDKPVITSCGSGVTAAVLALQLERCGAGQVTLYDGSWAEYAAQADAEIVTGA